MTVVFFLFLTHLGLGLLAMLPFVPDRAGTSYFKFCSAAAAFTMTAGVGLLLRRFGTVGGAAAPGESAYRALLLTAVASLAFTIVYNRARHFSWRRLQPVLLGGSLLTGAATVVVAAPSPPDGSPSPLALLAARDRVARERHRDRALSRTATRGTDGRCLASHCAHCASDCACE